MNGLYISEYGITGAIIMIVPNYDSQYTGLNKKKKKSVTLAAF